MNILISVNRNYFEAAIIMLRSLFYNNSGYDFTIYLFHSELDDKRLEIIRRLIENHNGILVIQKIDDAILKDIPVALLSKETYYRLMAPSLLPNDLDRILYLDIDMLITGDIKGLYEAEFGNNLFMAVPDTSNGVELFKKKLRLRKHNVYINAGVLLFNLKKLREEFDLETALNFAKKNPDKVPNCDQDVINGLYNDRIGHLDWSYNYEARFHSIKEVLCYPFVYHKTLQQIRIIHYMGSKKPWKKDFDGKYLREYCKYSINTSYQKEIERNIRYSFVNIIKYCIKNAGDKLKGYLE